MNEYVKKIATISAVLLAVFAAGVSGYVLIEGWSFFDALYMTVITLTTVGYGEVRPLTTDGRVFTIFLLLIGFGILTTAVTYIMTFMLSEELSGMLRRRKMEKLINAMRGHFIICARGETGKYVVEEFVKTKRQIVVITQDKELAVKLLAGNIPIVDENPAEDSVLLKCGIENAAGLAAVLHEDRDNLFVVLSARAINPRIRIVAQAVEKNSVAKLQKAGADEVVLSDAIGGMRIASTMLRPAVVSFLDSMLRGEGETLRVEDAVIPENSPLAGKTIDESGITEKTGLMIIAVKETKSDKYSYNPGLKYEIKAGDALIVIGNPDQVDKLKKLAAN